MSIHLNNESERLFPLKSSLKNARLFVFKLNVSPTTLLFLTISENQPLCNLCLPNNVSVYLI